MALEIKRAQDQGHTDVVTIRAFNSLGEPMTTAVHNNAVLRQYGLLTDQYGARRRQTRRVATESVDEFFDQLGFPDGDTKLVVGQLALADSIPVFSVSLYASTYRRPLSYFLGRHVDYAGICSDSGNLAVGLPRMLMGTAEIYGMADINSPEQNLAAAALFDTLNSDIRSYPQ